MAQCLGITKVGSTDYVVVLNMTATDPKTCNYIAISGSEYATYQQLSQETIAPFDYTMAAGFWSLAFTFILGLYLISKKVGFILQAVKNY